MTKKSSFPMRNTISYSGLILSCSQILKKQTAPNGRNLSVISLKLPSKRKISYFSDNDFYLNTVQFSSILPDSAKNFAIACLYEIVKPNWINLYVILFFVISYCLIVIYVIIIYTYCIEF